MANFQIRALTQPDIFSGEREAIAALLDAGLTWLHLRKPKLDLRETRDFLLSLPEECLPKMILHDHHPLAEEFPLGGIHFNSRNPFEKGGGVRTKDPLQKSLSVHEFRELDDLPEEIETVFFAPVFPSLSKKDHVPKYSLEEMAASIAVFKNKSRAKVLALGGIDENNIAAVVRMGFDGAALLGALWNDFSKDRNVASLVERFKNLKETSQTFSEKISQSISLSPVTFPKPALNY